MVSPDKDLAGYPANEIGYSANKTRYPANQTGYAANKTGCAANKTGYPANRPGYPGQLYTYICFQDRNVSAVLLFWNDTRSVH